jgi:ferrous iron transport protein B
MKILLMGNPNVGKSVIFSRLTGTKVIASNYPGSTVGYTKGYFKHGSETSEIIDVPGTYTLEPTSDAERVAAEMVKTGDMVINVIDATNLERNLNLTLQLLEQHIPMIIALNMWDDTKHLGINIDLEKLGELLGVPVIPTVAVSGQGIKELGESLDKAVIPDHPQRSNDERWVTIGNIISQVQTVTHRHHTWRERLADASVRPIPGTLMAIAILGGSFFLVRLIGESLIKYIFDPVFDYVIAPPLLKLGEILGNDGFLHDILLGSITTDSIDFVESFGVLTTGLYVPFAMV